MQTPGFSFFGSFISGLLWIYSVGARAMSGTWCVLCYRWVSRLWLLAFNWYGGAVIVRYVFKLFFYVVELLHLRESCKWSWWKVMTWYRDHVHIMSIGHIHGFLLFELHTSFCIYSCQFSLSFKYESYYCYHHPCLKRQYGSKLIYGFRWFTLLFAIGLIYRYGWWIHLFIMDAVFILMWVFFFLLLCIYVFSVM